MRVDDELYEFSHTEISTFKTCKRKWYLEYYLKLQRKKSLKNVARDSGILVHEALHYFYSLGQNDFAKQQMYAYLLNAKEEDLANCEDFEIKIAKDSHELALIIVDGYIEWLQETHADAPYEFTASGSEEKLTVPGPVEGTLLKGFLDLNGTHKSSNDLVVLDNKVVADINTPLKVLHLNEQAPLYAILLKLNQPDNQRGFRVIWNFLKRNKRSGRAKPPFYQRYELAVNADMLQVFWQQLHGSILDILDAERRLNEGQSHQVVAYPTPTPDCSWKCPFFSVCGMMNDPRSDPDYMIANYYELKTSRSDSAPVDDPGIE